MDWYDATKRYHEKTFPHECRLSCLAEEWQRELAALWRLEADVNNGAYLQFLSNWGRESYEYASQGLKRIGANKMASIIDNCQSLVDEHINLEEKTQEQMWDLMPNELIDRNGNLLKEPGSVLPDTIIARIYDLSYEFMDYPDDLSGLGTRYYRKLIERDEERQARQ